MNGEHPPEGIVIVRGTGEGFAQQVVAGSHRFVSDEPVPKRVRSLDDWCAGDLLKRQGFCSGFGACH